MNHQTDIPKDLVTYPGDLKHQADIKLTEMLTLVEAYYRNAKCSLLPEDFKVLTSLEARAIVREVKYAHELKHFTELLNGVKTPIEEERIRRYHFLKYPWMTMSQDEYAVINKLLKRYDDLDIQISLKRGHFRGSVLISYIKHVRASTAN